MLNWASQLVSCLLQVSNFSAISQQDQVFFWRNDDDICLDQHAEWDFYSSRSLKQQSTGRHVNTRTQELSTLGHGELSTLGHVELSTLGHGK